MTVASTQTTAECPLCKSFSHRVHRHDKRTLQDVGLAHYRMTLQLQVPKVLGADDFVFRRGRQYGTILVDLEHHQPVALLADRKAETLADWWLHHPGVEVVSRDRSKIYRSGVNQGAPDALQVADRFHLMQNLTETLEKVFSHCPADLNAIEQQQRHLTWRSCERA